MDRLGDKLFARATLPGDEHGTAGFTDGLDHPEQVLHPLAPADEVSHPVLFLELSLQVGVLFPQALLFESPFDDVAQLLHEVVGLQDVVESAHLEGLDGRGRCGVCGEQDEFSRGSLGSKAPQQIDPRHVGHADIGNDDVEVLLANAIQPLLAAVCDGDIAPLALQENLEHLPDRELIIDNEDLGVKTH